MNGPGVTRSKEQVEVRLLEALRVTFRRWQLASHPQRDFARAKHINTLHIYGDFIARTGAFR
jgi:hypothetical protein